MSVAHLLRPARWRHRIERRWLPGGFSLEQRIELDFMQYEIESVEFIGYNPETESFPSTVFSNMSPGCVRFGHNSLVDRSLVELLLGG